jgi:Uma2 family endonuclease
MTSAPSLHPGLSGLPDLPDRKGYEYVDGEWVRVPMGAESVLVAYEVIRAIDDYVRPRGLGRVVPHEAGLQIFPGHPRRYRKPDGSYFSRGRLPGDRVPEKHIRVAPDLVIEVISPTDRGENIEQKLRDYFEAGVRRVWVIYPKARTAHIYRPGGLARVLREDEEIDGEDVIPGFRVRLADILQPAP